MRISVRYPKLKKSYKTTAKKNEDLLIDRINDLVIEHNDKKMHVVKSNRGGSLMRERKKKIATFKLT